MFPFLFSQLPIFIGQGPVQPPSPLVPPDLRGCSEPSEVENKPAGHSLNSVMQLFQESNNWTLCSHWVGTGNLGSSLEDTLCSWGQSPGLGSGKVASGANHERARCLGSLHTYAPPQSAGAQASSGRGDKRGLLHG